MAFRREQLKKVEDALDASETHLQEIGYLACDFYLDYAKEYLWVEEKLIETCDLLGLTYDDEAAELTSDHLGRRETNIFEHFLTKKVQMLGLSFVELRSYDYERMPLYYIGLDEIAEITAGNKRAAYALKAGYACIRDIPAELRGDEKVVERVEWLCQRVPDEKWQKIEALDLSALIRNAAG